jgi:hypothetical protein
MDLTNEIRNPGVEGEGSFPLRPRLEMGVLHRQQKATPACRNARALRRAGTGLARG